MGNGWFAFKRFVVMQTGASMKVGTDGVLLGSWVSLAGQPGRMLDVGTGTGLIALMLAQRSEAWHARIDAVELDRRSALQAVENVSASEWAKRIDVLATSFQEYADQCGKTYDLIVSNPPYFSDSLVSPSTGRTMARHTRTLGSQDLIRCAMRLLSAGGKLSVIVPAESSVHMVSTAIDGGFSLIRRMDVASVEGRDPFRTLFEFGLEPAQTCKSEQLAIESRPGCFSEMYRELTKDFYLKF